MKACDACKTHVASEAEFCPLCGEPLRPSGQDFYLAAPGNAYPDLSRRLLQYNFLRRLFLFLTLLGCGLSLLINFLVTPSFMWSFLVVAAAAYCWVTVPTLLRSGRNFGFRATVITILTCLLVVAMDFIVGYRGWSVSYVLPSLLTAGIASITMFMVFNRTNHAQYVLYQAELGVFGFLPLVLYLLGIAENLVLVLITAGIALASLLGTFVFGDRSIKTEFKRRFHF